MEGSSSDLSPRPEQRWRRTVRDRQQASAPPQLHGFLEEQHSDLCCWNHSNPPPSGTSPWTLQRSVCGSRCGGGVGCAVEVQEPGTVLAGAPLLWQRGGNCWFSWQQQHHEVKPVRVEGGQPPLSDRGGLSPHEDQLSMTCVWGRGTGQRGGTFSSFWCYLQPPPSL